MLLLQRGGFFRPSISPAQHRIGNTGNTIGLRANDSDFAADLAVALSDDSFRAYTSGDIVGVEVGAAVKNVLAIGAGMSDGLGFGANARVALITRGLVEMTRLGVALGARQETFMGLAGMGPLRSTKQEINGATTPKAKKNRRTR